MMQGGLSMLAADPTISTGQAIAAGVMGAQQGARQYGGQLRANEMQAKIQQMVGQGASPAQMQAVMMELIARGGEDNLRAAQMLAQIISAQQGRDGSTKPLVTSPGQTVFDPAGGKEMYVNPNAPQTAQRAPQSRQVYNPATRQYEYHEYDPVTGGWVPTGQLAKPDIGAGQPTELERRASFFVPMATEALQYIDNFESGPGAPTRLNQLAEATSFNELQSPEARQLYTAGRILGDAYLRITSGAAIKDEEIDMFVRSYLPYPGDDTATRQTKRVMRAHLMNGLRVLASRAQSQVFRSSAEALSPEGLQEIQEIGAQSAESSLPPIEEAAAALEDSI
jgi:hypothetical protein